MSVGDYCNREVVIIDGDASVAGAAQRMREYHVGDLVVVETREGAHVPVGIVTDRDLVVEVMVPALDPRELAVRDIVTDPLVTVREDEGLFDALDRMRDRGIRRIPVVGAEGALVGILTVDDVIGLLAEMLGELAALVDRERRREERRRP